MSELSMEELTERFYLVREQRNKLLWTMKSILEMATDELREFGVMPKSLVSQIEADARAALEETAIKAGQRSEEPPC
jgi:hypothetical protein